MSGASELTGVHSITEEPDGARFALVVRRYLRHPPERVWAAITEPEQIRQWFLTTAKIDARVGGAIDMTLDPAGVRSTGQIIEWDPPRRYAYELTLPDLPDLGADGPPTLVRWELNPVEGGTELVLTQRRLSRKAAEVLRVGLPFFVLRLEALLDGRSGPVWGERVEAARRFAGPAPRAP